jgi:magnesium chelatase family protein
VEVSAVYSAAGLLQGGLLQERPFRAPHHDVSVAGLVGGGPVPRPGEISLAHHGVLFLDELLEFQRPALEALRQPLEERAITLVRARASVRFPAAFALVAAMNPCPCGYWGSSVRTCTCSLDRVRRYRGRLSGPLLDRFDLQVFTPHVDYRELSAAREGEPSQVVRARVLAAREQQRIRLARLGLGCNAQMGPHLLARHCALDGALEAHLHEVARRRGLSVRAVHRVLRVARTLADLGGRERIAARDLFHAIEFRFLDHESL